MQKIRVKIEGFREDVRSFRAEFLERCPFGSRGPWGPWGPWLLWQLRDWRSIEKSVFPVFFSALCSTCCCRCCCFNPLDAASWLFVVQSRMEKEVWGTCLNQVKMPWRATTTRVLAFASRCLTCFRISCVCDMQSKNAWNYHNVSDSYIVTYYYSKYYLYLYT